MSDGSREVLSLVRPRPHVALPAGDVTFVFTDVEGSTRLLAALGERFRPLLAVHQSIVTRAMSESGAELVSAAGDGLFFASGFAAAAVNGVREAMAALAAHEWPPGHPFRIRAGAHTGPATPVGNTYVALAVHQAARISAAAHGGQLLASAATAALVPVTARPLGRFWLKDFDEPVELVQFDDGDHPPLRLPAEGVRRIVVPETSFIGRDSELAELRRRLEAHRMVTVCGGGGYGKTRLALEFAAVAPQELVAVAELAAARTPSEVENAVAAALDIAQSPDSTVMDLLIQRLRATPSTLLVLDNCEQALDAVADVAGCLLEAACEVRVLCTTREPISVPGEQVLRLQPLEVSDIPDTLAGVMSTDSGRLLVDRVLARDADLVPREEDGAHIAAICRRFEGWPLAIELIAAQIAAVGFAATRAALDEGDLGPSGRGGPQRHRSVQSTLDWSYQLLKPSERTVWERLAVFVAPFRLEDAVSVAADESLSPADARTGVAALVAKSVLARVRAQDGDRYRMHQSVREFGLRRLTDLGQAGVVRDRHAAWATAFVMSNFMVPTPEHWDEAFQVCRDDLVAARQHLQAVGSTDEIMQLGGTLATFDTYTGRYVEGAAILRQLADRDDATAQVLAQAGELAARGDLSQADAYLNRATAAAPDALVASFIGITRVWVAIAAGRLEEGEQLARVALSQPPTSWMAHDNARSALAYVVHSRCEFEEALRLYRRVVEEALQRSSLRLAVPMQFNVANVLMHQGRWEEAAAEAEKGRSIAVASDSGESLVWLDLMLAATRDHDPRQVRDRLCDAERRGFPVSISEYDTVLPALRAARMWRTLAVAAGAYRQALRAHENPSPLLHQLLADADAATEQHLGIPEAKMLRARGADDPSFAVMARAADEDTCSV